MNANKFSVKSKHKTCTHHTIYIKNYYIEINIIRCDVFVALHSTCDVDKMSREMNKKKCSHIRIGIDLNVGYSNGIFPMR